MTLPADIMRTPKLNMTKYCQPIHIVTGEERIMSICWGWGWVGLGWVTVMSLATGWLRARAQRWLVTEKLLPNRIYSEYKHHLWSADIIHSVSSVHICSSSRLSHSLLCKYCFAPGDQRQDIVSKFSFFKIQKHNYNQNHTLLKYSWKTALELITIYNFYNLCQDFAAGTNIKSMFWTRFTVDIRQHANAAYS